MTPAPPADRGRPLRFLGAIATGWIGLRVVMLLPAPEPPPPVAPIAPVPVSPASPPVRVMTARIAVPHGADAEGLRGGGVVGGRPNDWSHCHPSLKRHPDRVSGATVPQRQAGQNAQWRPKHAQQDGSAETRPRQRDERVDPPERDPPHRKRWSVSAWTVARAGIEQGSAPAGGQPGSQLGGSQAGVRLVRTLDRRGRVALAGRVTTPLGPGLREASVGLEWQPTRLPIKLVAENRFALGRGQGGPGLAVIGGFGPIAVGHGLHAEAYGQAGAIRRARIEPYADGAMRVTHGIARLGRMEVGLGAGAWGGAQRGAARFDLGPGVTFAVPVGRAALRLTLDWRERVVGRARPGAGPALTLGTDF